MPNVGEIGVTEYYVSPNRTSALAQRRYLLRLTQREIKIKRKSKKQEWANYSRTILFS